jgi:hypothetical protein
MYQAKRPKRTLAGIQLDILSAPMILTKTRKLVAKRRYLIMFAKNPSMVAIERCLGTIDEPRLELLRQQDFSLFSII